MTISDPSFIFLGLILPSLFAVTMIAEGVWKLSRQASGWVNIGLGVGVMILTFWVYFGLLPSALSTNL